MIAGAMIGPGRPAGQQQRMALGQLEDGAEARRRLA